MSKFDKEMFSFDGMYLTYGAERKFVARFKRGGMASFKSFLIKNFAVEEYFTLSADMAPLEILATKGFVMPSTAKMLKKFGFEPNAAGQKAYINAVLSNTL
jgi:hypothetical protein